MAITSAINPLGDPVQYLFSFNSRSLLYCTLVNYTTQWKVKFVYFIQHKDA